MNLIISKVIKLVALVLELQDLSDIFPSTQLEADLGFDSGMYIELIMYLEDEFPGLSLDPSTLRREDFMTVSTTANFVYGRLAKREAMQ